MKHKLMTAIITLSIILSAAFLTSTVSAFDKLVNEAVVAGDWDKVVLLIGPSLGMQADYSSKLLMAHACRATNRNNTAERQVDIQPTADDRKAWFNWADSMRTAHPENPTVLTLWSDARFKVRKLKEYAEEGVSLSLAAVNRAIELDRDNAFAYKVRGDVFLAELRIDPALTDYTKAIELDSGLVEARFNLAVAYEKKEDYDRAIKEYTKALEMSPAFAKALTFRGAVYRELDNINQAIEDCNAALKADPTYVLAHFIKGSAYAQADMKEMAIKSFRAFIESAPSKFARMARNANARIMMLEGSE